VHTEIKMVEMQQVNAGKIPDGCQ